MEIIITRTILPTLGGGSYSDHSNSYTHYGQTRDIASDKYKCIKDLNLEGRIIIISLRFNFGLQIAHKLKI